MFGMLLTTCLPCIPKNSEILQTVAASLGSSGNNTIHQLSDLQMHQTRLCRPHLLLVLLCDNDKRATKAGCLHHNRDITEFRTPNIMAPFVPNPTSYHKEVSGFLKMLIDCIK